MSDPAIDALAETARNRGLKLVRSRVRTPNKHRFGKVGLTDKTGKAVFGMDSKGPTAMPEEVEGYLRALGSSDWGASLDIAAPQRKRVAKAPAREPANDRQHAPQPKPKTKSVRKPKPEPVLAIREATQRDADEIVKLNRLLGVDVGARVVRKKIKALALSDLAPLVATLDNKVVGVCAISRMETVHREKPVGRISHLVVAEKTRGRGIGRLLTDAAEQRLKMLGCGLIEVTSNDRLAAAHAFYRHIGYQRTSIRFVKRP